MLYEFLETGKVLYATKKTRYNFTIPNIKILATGNSKRFTEPFLSRFKPEINLPDYTYDQFKRVAIRLLRERYEIPAETSEAIARVVWEDF